ncbi:MAG: PEP-utilizing enzyme, partial [Candidatus Micrarchaeota archaeon]|nr:PEP-utilizing enzyme [Candidatus Micrarchaeota archaeon]
MAQEPWIQHWHGKWSLLSCSHFGEHYTKTISGYLGTAVGRAVLVFRDGFSACYFPQKDVDAFGRFLAGAAKKNPLVLDGWAKALERQTDAVLAITRKKKPVWPHDFHALWSALSDYVGPHIAVKKVVDYLPEKTLEKHLPRLQEARTYSDPVYAESEAFVQRALAVLARRAGFSARLAKALLREDWDAYWQNGLLPLEETLETRFAASALSFRNGKRSSVFGGAAVALEALLKGGTALLLKGQTAYPGTVVGTVRIVADPNSKSLFFNKGDILVAGMTRPPFIPLMKKAGAVVTDAGGVLCHAAIAARELKIPCVVGTKTATTSFRDGDQVEVDASRGTV